jgi:hypothetical protein
MTFVLLVDLDLIWINLDYTSFREVANTMYTYNFSRALPAAILRQKHRIRQEKIPPWVSPDLLGRTAHIPKNKKSDSLIKAKKEQPENADAMQQYFPFPQCSRISNVKKKTKEKK